MNGNDLKRLRQRMGLTQGKFAELINGPLERNYGGSMVGQWELERRAIPAAVAAYLGSLEMELNLDGAFPVADPDRDILGERTFVDTAPGDDKPRTFAADLTGSFEHVCIELFEMIATGTGMVGAAMGNDKVKMDGRLIDQDKVALGKAYARLAETNETFRRMLTGVTSGGAVLQVCLVTGTTAGAIWRNHSTPVDPGPLRVVPGGGEDGRGVSAEAEPAG